MIMKEITASDIITTEENEKIYFSFDVDLEEYITFDSKVNPTDVEYERVEWLYANNNKYPEGSVNYDKVGKWMLFIEPKWVNHAWGKIKSGIATGELWDSKVTTNNPKKRFHAIMIYTKDYTNLEDVIRVLDYLERTRLKAKNKNIRYKADWQTRAGIYAGGKERPWIYASETVRELGTSNVSQSYNVVANDQPVHSTIDQPVHSTIIGQKTFRTDGGHQMHSGSVHQFPCTDCQKKFKTAHSLLQHFTAVHYQGEENLTKKEKVHNPDQKPAHDQERWKHILLV